MRQFIYKIISILIKLIYPNAITGKLIEGSSKKIFYEKSQHLSFLFKTKINYDSKIQEMMREYIKKGDVIFDIGGNIGQYAIPLSELVGEKGSVYSFEPDYKNFSFLQFNKNINKCLNLECFNYGIGELNTEVEFFRDTKNRWKNGVF